MSNENIDIITLANRVADEKENIRQAIEARGVTIPATTPLTDYAAKIMSIDTENDASDIYLIDENYDPTTTDLLLAGNYGTIADNAFARQTSLQTVDLNYVQAIGNGVFDGCSNLTSVSGNHLRYVGDDAFKKTGLTSFSNNTIKYIGNDAFENSAVASVSIPNCEIVKGGAFMQADSLETINMNSARAIPGECFYGCNILNSVSADNAKSIGAFAFYQAGNGAYTTYGTTFTLSFPEVQSVGMDAFYQVNGLTSISLPNCIAISNDAFNACSHLATITIPKVNSIAAGAFNNTNAIYTLNIPECTSIGSYNFNDNSHRLTSLTIADGCVFGDYCFKNGITTVNGKPSKIGSYNYTAASTHTTDIDLSEVTTIGDRCFTSSNSTSTINFKDEIVDLKNCTKIGITTNSDNYCCFTADGGSSSTGVLNNVKKLWLNGNCTIARNSASSLSMFNHSTCHIYTDAASKPSGWSSICTSATWHFGATHEDFENA